MSIVNSKLYQLVEMSANFFLLNILWVLSCLPVITFFPATIAMFGVIRDWHMKKDSGVIKPFLKHIKTNVKKSIFLTLVWMPFSIILLSNIKLLEPTESIVSLLMTLLIGMILLVFMCTTLYIFPVVVHFELPMWQLIRNAFFIATSHWKYTGLGLAIVIIIGYFMYQYPILMFFITSLVSYFIYATCYKAFKQLGAEY
ncbi:YesL family protein [Bacillus solitudinis]|uniref:YesL family protein n=1 Tax=Bacillus solitudinis TaxID=2014074 RepID=UPI000C24FB98|nr:DUF624 domain-containing protein [Bacillus solitudinis]